MVIDLLKHLNLKFKPSGTQFVIDCPACGKMDHGYVNIEDHCGPDGKFHPAGVWHCKVCTAHGNAYQLILAVLNCPASEAMEIRNKYFPATTNQPAAQPAQPRTANRPAGLRNLTDEELGQFCKIKNITLDSTKLFSPYYSSEYGECIVFPASDGGDKPCGWLRCKMNGEAFGR